jgi:hypothetical protein
MDEEVKSGMFTHFENTLPVGHVGTTEEIAEVYMFLYVYMPICMIMML